MPKKQFTDIYNSGKHDATGQTYKLICESEIARLGVLARKMGKGSREWEIWREQKELHYADRKQKEMIAVCKNILAQKMAASPAPAPTKPRSTGASLPVAAPA